MIIHTISNIGAEDLIPSLTYIIKSDKFEIPAKISAVFAMNVAKLPDGDITYDQVFDTLSLVIFDTTADVSLRQAALTTLLGWGPSSSFWYRLIRDAASETNPQMIRLINKIISENLHNTNNEILYQ